MAFGNSASWFRRFFIRPAPLPAAKLNAHSGTRTARPCQLRIGHVDPPPIDGAGRQ